MPRFFPAIILIFLQFDFLKFLWFEAEVFYHLDVVFDGASGGCEVVAGENAGSACVEYPALEVAEVEDPAACDFQVGLGEDEAVECDDS